MRRDIVSFCSAVVACMVLAGCKSHSAAVPASDAPAASTGPAANDATVAKPPKPRSPHNVMVSLAGGEALTRDQQPYVIGLQEKIADRWQPVAAKLKYSVGIEFTLTRPGLCTNVQYVSSMGPRKTIDSCRDAILRAGPFEPLPAQFKDAPQTFMCEFMYNPPADSK